MFHFSLSLKFETCIPELTSQCRQGCFPLALGQNPFLHFCQLLEAVAFPGRLRPPSELATLRLFDHSWVVTCPSGQSQERFSDFKGPIWLDWAHLDNLGQPRHRKVLNLNLIYKVPRTWTSLGAVISPSARLQFPLPGISCLLGVYLADFSGHFKIQSHSLLPSLRSNVTCIL